MLLAIASPEIIVDGVTTVAGNVPQPRVTDNALAVLALAGNETVGVYRGCERPMLRPLYTAEYVHGPTGLDGADLPEPTQERRDAHAVDYIIEACLASDDGTVTLCPIGPLTNIALAIIKEPRISAKVAEILWMGGAFNEPGNTTPVAEFNAYVDPHAAHVVFTAGIPLTVFPLDVTHRALMYPRHVEALEAYGTSVATAAAGMIRYYEQYDIAKYDIEGAPMHDPCVIAYLIDPTLFGGSAHHVVVDTVHEETVGNTTIDDAAGEANAVVMTNVDAERFFSLVVERIGSL